MLRRLRLVIILVGIVPLAGAAELVVALDGAGQFKSLQQAVDSIPANNTERVVIHVKSGTYKEEVRIRNSFVTLRGEDRKQTRIVADVDTSACPTGPNESKEEHCATVIGDGTDLMFENLTVENSHHGKSGKGAALSLVNDSTRIVIFNADIVGYGGDTLTLSARRDRIGAGSDYYLNNVYVSGTYHIIVPRGAAYVVNSKFWCLGGERNCLFAEGITRSTDKLVIRDSAIDGPEPFGLGSYFRDAAWYFVHDIFSSNLLPDGSIHREPAKNYGMKWGEDRIYFAANTGPNYPWLKDNLQDSPARNAASVTAQWVFPQWDPENASGPQMRALKTSANRIEVIFDESVTVEGRPKLVLTTGSASYMDGSGSNTLRFQSSGQGRPLQLNLNGGSIYATTASLRRRNANLKLPTSAKTKH